MMWDANLHHNQPTNQLFLPPSNLALLRKYNEFLPDWFYERAKKKYYVTMYSIEACNQIFPPRWFVGNHKDKKIARIVHQDQLNRARNADDVTRTCEKFVYFIFTITRLYDYQHGWQIFREIHEVRQGMWVLLYFRMLNGLAAKPRSHGQN